MKGVRNLISFIHRAGVRRPGTVKLKAMGREREFTAWDLGEDTFISEKGIVRHLNERPSVLMVEKRDLRRGAKGHVFTMTGGNHSVAAFPLLDGRFWNLAKLPPAKRGEVLMKSVLCANVVGGRIETSQRDVPTAKVTALDAWLRGVSGLTLAEVVMGDRNEQTLEHYRRLGEDWRVKPLAWTESEMRVALAASRRRIATKLRYYHSARGVHFLAYPEFAELAELAGGDFPEFVKALKELVSVYEDNRVSFCRLPKLRGHHEIEFFGCDRGVAVEKVVPELERLMEQIALDRIGQLAVVTRMQEIAGLFRSLLTRPELADPESREFIESMYIHVTGEIYAVVGDGSAKQFDDRRTALPGASFVDGHPVFHPGCDQRSMVLLTNLRMMMSKDEYIQYANIYELRDERETAPVGKGTTRELVYKTNLRPVEASLIEKPLSSRRKDAGRYMLARIGALRSLGISLSGYYRLLRQRRSDVTAVGGDHYIRLRCEGEPIDAIPATYFKTMDEQFENREVVLALCALMGDAAAQNMAMKKYDGESGTPLFGIGKEIYEFEYDIVKERVLPKKVSCCSVRGSFGWPCTDRTDANLADLANFYLGCYARTLREFVGRHPVPMDEAAARFFTGFEFRTHALEWELGIMRTEYENFRPVISPRYGFRRKWEFLQWSLERQARRLETLKAIFMAKVANPEGNPPRDGEPAEGPIES